MDPTTTLFTFMLKTEPLVKTVCLIGSWDNFTSSYPMERDSRRDRGQWRGCHSFKNIICDGEVASSNTGRHPSSRSGGLKMGSTYYYYYEIDGSTESHDPNMPSTTACPYLPGQRVNTMTVPFEQSSRQRSASASSMHRLSCQTMNPADRFMAPRRPPATPAVRPDVSMPALQHRSSSPRLQIRQKAAANAAAASAAIPPSTAPSTTTSSTTSSTPSSTWLPRRLFVRRQSPFRKTREESANRHRDDSDTDSSQAAGWSTSSSSSAASLSSAASSTTHNIRGRTRLVSWASSSSLSSLLARPSAPSSLHSCASTVNMHAVAASQESLGKASGTRSRDISPESLRRFLIEDVEKTTMTEENKVASHVLGVSSKSASAQPVPDDVDDADDDEHNFAVSAVSESAPITMLSPPPPPRAQTPQPSLGEKRSVSGFAVPDVPTRLPPAVPARHAARGRIHGRPRQLSPIATGPTSQHMPPSLLSAFAPSSSLPPSPPLPALSFQSPGLSGASTTSSQSETDDEADVDLDALLPPPRRVSCVASVDSPSPKAAQEQHDRLVAALHSAFLHGSGAPTLIPGGQGQLGQLVDELGWMATAIQG